MRAALSALKMNTFAHLFLLIPPMRDFVNYKFEMGFVYHIFMCKVMKIILKTKIKMQLTIGDLHVRFYVQISWMTEDSN